MSRLYIGGINKSVKSSDLLSLFERFGEVKDSLAKGDYGFVEFSDETCAEAARKELNATVQLGCDQIYVQIAREKGIYEYQKMSSTFRSQFS